eukprot:SAG31_NODE_653_length_13152_cov_4.899487_1_plen_747_part_00
MDIAALASFEIDPALKQFISSMYKEFQADKAALQAELADERRERKEETRLLVGQVVGLQAALHEFSNKSEANMQQMSLRLDQCEAETHPFIKEMQRRRAQSAAGGADTVHIFKRTISAAGHISGRVDESNGGHRLLTEEGADCSGAEISRQISAINVACCDEPEEDCSNGKVHTCNAGCGALIMPLWTSCRAQLGSAAKTLQDAVALCPPPDISPTHMDAQMFMVTCPAGLPADDCIPACTATTHGYLLLLNIDGTDTTLTCSLSDLLYSWVGAAALGGFLGQNVAAFVSAVISGAAGTYVLTLEGDADVGTDLVVQPGQNVIISGDMGLTEAPSWGGGRFVIRHNGSLQLEYIALAGGSGSGGEIPPAAILTVEAGGRFSVAESLLLPGEQTWTEHATPLPCDGGFDGVCHGAHTGYAIVETALTVSLETPLICGYQIDLPDKCTTKEGLPITFVGQWFIVESGPCTISQDGLCVGRPDGYGDDEACVIMPTGSFKLHCQAFDTTTFWDVLQINDTRYEGTDCPSAVTVTALTSISWTSSHYEHGTGWEICGPLALSEHERLVDDGVDLAADAVCFNSTYLTVPNDHRFSTSSGQGANTDHIRFDGSLPSVYRCDAPNGYTDGNWLGQGPFGLGATTKAWYRLPVGKQLATRNTGLEACGTFSGGWLSGWPANAKEMPDHGYHTAFIGAFAPPIGAPPRRGIVCFDDGSNGACHHPVEVYAVSCGAFVLWELPPPTSCPSAYCLS